ncbi:MAG: hypothetical protein V7719_12760 [Psychroserpens sp.]|uniref:hypothetical protein n=1 Tax=Psychroserpens sp. TaxID=2020870 RepID=UPI0030025087
MKKIIFILLFAFTIQLSAQEQNWLSDNKVALKQSETQNKPVLVFVTDNQKAEAYKTLKDLLFNSDSYNGWASKMILLKLDISDKQSPNVRLGIHYTKQTSAPGLSLIDKNGKTIIDPLVDITAQNIETFIALVNSKL